MTMVLRLESGEVIVLLASVQNEQDFLRDIGELATDEFPGRELRSLLKKAQELVEALPDREGSDAA